MPKNRILGLAFPVFLFFFTLTIYVLTLSRSVYFGDSGEFIAVAKTLGIAHPPGYPLYTMLAHLFTYLPFGNLPFKVNLFSAVTSSLTVVVIYFACLKLTKNRLVSASASLFLAFSYLFWLYSLVAEVFSLNNLFVALIILISLHIFEKPRERRLFYLLAFVFGLALTNHHTILFITPALLFLVLATNPKLFLQPKLLIISSLCFFLGLLPYLYLPIRASQDPILNWGDPDTIDRFIGVILRRDFGTFSLSSGVERRPFSIDPVIFYFVSTFLQTLGIGVILALWGFFVIFLKSFRLFFFIFLAYFLTGPLFIFLTKVPMDNILIRGGLERFSLASTTLLALAIAFSIHQILQAAPKVLKYFTYLILITPLLLLVINFPKVNQSKNFLYEELGQQIFEAMPPNSLLVTFGDKGTMIARYLQAGLNKRPDIMVANFHFLPDTWYQENLKQQHPGFSFPYAKYQPGKLSLKQAVEIICKEAAPNQPTFIENKTDFFNPIANPNCSYHPRGPIVRIESSKNPLSKDELINEYKSYWQPFEEKFPQKFTDYRTRIALDGYSQTETFVGALLGNFGEDDLALKAYLGAYKISQDNGSAPLLAAQIYLDRKDFDQALEWYKKSIEADPWLSTPYKELGILYLNEKNDKKKALYYFKKYLKLAPRSEKEQINKLIKDLEIN